MKDDKTIDHTIERENLIRLNRDGFLPKKKLNDDRYEKFVDKKRGYSLLYDHKDDAIFGDYK